MDGSGFDRITKVLAATSARRQALRGTVAGLLSGALGQVNQIAEAKKKKKKKKKKKGNGAGQCANVTEVCTANNDCCDAELGVIVCRGTLATKDNCGTLFPGNRCCALDGVICDPQQGNCGCCDDHVCTIAADTLFRCQPAEP